MDSIDKYFTKKMEKRLVWKSLKDVHKNASFHGNLTVDNFKQGCLGNCGMMTAMASLATNNEIYNKVVEQRDSIKKVTKLSDSSNKFVEQSDSSSKKAKQNDSNNKVVVKSDSKNKLVKVSDSNKMNLKILNL